MIAGNSKLHLPFAITPGGKRDLVGHLCWKQRRMLAATDLKDCSMGLYQPLRSLPWSGRRQHRKG